MRLPVRISQVIFAPDVSWANGKVTKLAGSIVRLSKQGDNLDRLPKATSDRDS